MLRSLPGLSYTELEEQVRTSSSWGRETFAVWQFRRSNRVHIVLLLLSMGLVGIVMVRSLSIAEALTMMLWFHVPLSLATAGRIWLSRWTDQGRAQRIGATVGAILMCVTGVCDAFSPPPDGVREVEYLMYDLAISPFVVLVATTFGASLPVQLAMVCCNLTGLWSHGLASRSDQEAGILKLTPLVAVVAESTLCVGLVVLFDRQNRELHAHHQRLEEQNQMVVEELLHLVCHEVRNPLNGAIGNLRLAKCTLEQVAPIVHMMGQTGGASPPIMGQVMEHCKTMQEHVSNSLACGELGVFVLNSMNSLNRIRAGIHEPRMSPLSLEADVLPSVEAIVRPQLHEGVVLRTSFAAGARRRLATVQSDAMMLVQILTNLAQNAARFTRSGFVELGVALVDGQATRRAGDEPSYATVRFFVRDTGVGMDDATRRGIFERFTSSGGTGLGMYIVKNFVELLAGSTREAGGGKLAVRSPWNDAHTGTEVSFELRLLASAAAPGEAISPESSGVLQPKGVRLSAFLEESAAPSAISPEHSGPEEQRLPSGLRVLLADDMPLNNKLLGHALRKCRADWVIESCLSVDEALEMFSAAAAEQKPYDLCVVDEHMSDAPDAMVGSQAIAVMREREREAGGGARAVLVSCTGDSEMAGFEAAARAQGADGVWTKPFPNFANGELQGSLVGLLRAAGKC